MAVVVSAHQATNVSRLYAQGVVSGVLGAAAVALWFLVLDVARGRPFSTPTVLGTALFQRGADVASLAPLPVSLEMVVMFTWIHGLAFVVLGVLASRLLDVAARNASLGFGIVLLFVIFQFAFTVATMLFAAPLLQVLTWPAVLGANLLSASVMSLYLWRRGPAPYISP
jgi:hypothetical protein